MTKLTLRLTIFLTSLVLSLAAYAGPMADLETLEDLNRYIEKSGFNGVVLVAKDQSILFKKAYGWRNLEEKSPLSAQDRFQIGSITKQFVAASVLKLQEEGKLSLDDSLTTYLPEYKNKIPDEITIRDILNHTSGITNFTDHPEFWQNLDPSKILSLDEIIDFTLQFPLDFAPKTQWRYSNSGYIFAGKIIEAITGESWDRYIDSHFLAPLGMKDTGYVEQFETVSQVYPHIKNEGVLVPFRGFNLSWALSAGGLYSTVDDLLKWISLYSDSTLLSPESKRLMQTPFKNNYGLGLMITPFGNDININHSGKTPGFSSNISWLKQSHLSVIRLDNIDGQVAGISELLMNYFTFGKARVVKLERISVTPEKLQEYVGTYSLGGFEMKLFLEKGTLFLQTNDGQPPYELAANDVDSFSLLGLAGEEFIRDAGGKITGLIHYQNGRSSQFIKK